MPSFRRNRGRRGRTTRDHDSRSDAETARDLDGGHLLGEEYQREDGGDEGLQVAGERGPRGPDAVQGAEPEDIGEDERAERGEREQQPDAPAETVILALRLADPRHGQTEPAEREHDRADARGR